MNMNNNDSTTAKIYVWTVDNHGWCLNDDNRVVLTNRVENLCKLHLFTSKKKAIKTILLHIKMSFNSFNNSLKERRCIWCAVKSCPWEEKRRDHYFSPVCLHTTHTNRAFLQKLIEPRERLLPFFKNRTKMMNDCKKFFLFTRISTLFLTNR